MMTPIFPPTPRLQAGVRARSGGGVKALALAVSATLALSLGGAAGAAPAPLDLASHPKLDEAQLGQINAIVALSAQADSDWANMGSWEPGQGGFDSYRYQLAMMSYALAIAEHRYTPGYRELAEVADARLIDKMLLFDVWSYWEQTSRGAKNFDPSLTSLMAGDIDPIKYQNIMYSGHLFQMITTHAMLYGDARFEKPGSIRFVYNPVGRGLGPQEFSYDTSAFAKVLADQFQANGWKGIECEPNAIFPECNQHPMLGFSLYDRSHGTDYYPRISAAFKKQFADLSYIDPATSSFMAFYQIKQKRVIQRPGAWQDGWSGSFMHAWDKETVEAAYPSQKARFVAALPDGTATVKSRDANPTYSWDHGFFAVLAAEVGDRATRDAFLRYADAYWKPVWREGALVYPRQDRFRFPGDGPDVWRRNQPLTANGLLALARLDDKDGLYALYNRPFGPEHQREPYVAGIDAPRVWVQRAVYDAPARAFVLTVRPARSSATASAAWTLHNLDPARTYTVWRDGERLPAAARTDAADHRSLAVTAPISGETTYVVREG